MSIATEALQFISTILVDDIND